MCFTVALSTTAQNLANRYDATPLASGSFQSGSSISAFNHPRLPLVTAPGKLAVMSWGLIPHWVKDREQAESIRQKTLNARAETLWEKPSFRDAVKQHRCLIPMTGFYEYHHREEEKIKYLITLQEQEIFSVAGIWSEWKGAQSGRSFFSYSLITCDANPLMAEIHNTKQRMPVILSPEVENHWLNARTSKEELQKLLVPFPEEKMRAQVC